MAAPVLPPLLPSCFHRRCAAAGPSKLTFPFELLSCLAICHAIDHASLLHTPGWPFV